MESQIPPPQSASGLSKIQIAILAIALSALILTLLLAETWNQRQPQKTEKTAPVLTSEQRAEAQSMKSKSCAIVNRLKSAGAFTKIEAGYSGVTHAYVDRGFFEIPVDAKESTMKAVALCYIDINKKDQTGVVVIHNGYSGKRIGSFDFVSGLEME